MGHLARPGSGGKSSDRVRAGLKGLACGGVLSLDGRLLSIVSGHHMLARQTDSFLLWNYKYI